MTSAPTIPTILTNFELGWKTTFGPLRWNGAIYHEVWKKFQFAFLGANSFTEIHNAQGRAHQRHRERSQLCPRRPDAKRLGRLHGRQDQREHLRRIQRHHVRLHRQRRPISSLRGAVHGCRSHPSSRVTYRALHVAGLGQRQGPCPGRNRLSGIRAVIAQKANPAGRLNSDPYNYCAAAGALTPLGLCNPNIFQGKIRASTVVDLFAGLDWPRWSLEAFATNVFDERNELSAASRRAAAAREPWWFRAGRGRSGFAQG